MRIIARKALREFWRKHPDAEGQLRAWYAAVDQADFTGPSDVKAQYGNASILKAGRVVFNICGNKYRLIARIKYEYHVVYVRFVGTHEEYDKVDAETI
jgi:mRNA interferase HigB